MSVLLFPLEYGPVHDSQRPTSFPHAERDSPVCRRSLAGQASVSHTNQASTSGSGEAFFHRDQLRRRYAAMPGIFQRQYW